MGLEAGKVLKERYNANKLKWRPLREDKGAYLDGQDLKVFKMRLKGYKVGVKQGDITPGKDPKQDSRA
jgi:hypothetical protein